MFSMFGRQSQLEARLKEFRDVFSQFVHAMIKRYDDTNNLSRA
jgi:hypothetical protein